VIVNGTPLFLYFLTVAYFATYYTVLQIGWRAVRTRWPRSPVLHLAARAGLSYLVAFGETASMATEGMKKWFSYAEPRWVMTWGSLCYGTVFFVSLPIFYDLDEDPQVPPRPLRELVRDLLAANMVVLVAYVLFGWMIGRRG
jgi:cycloeucalenol cycloisomerase